MTDKVTSNNNRFSEIHDRNDCFYSVVLYFVNSTEVRERCPEHPAWAVSNTRHRHKNEYRCLFLSAGVGSGDQKEQVAEDVGHRRGLSVDQSLIARTETRRRGNVILL